MEIISAHPVLAVLIGVLILIAIAGETYRLLRERDRPEDCPRVTQHFHSGGLVSNPRLKGGEVPAILSRGHEHYMPRAFAARMQELVREGDFLIPSAPVSPEEAAEKVAKYRRVHMRNRFLPTDEDPARSDAMADQIVRDQMMAHEEHGAEVTDPAIDPANTTYYHLRVSVGKFTYIIGKEGYLGISEALLSGDESPIYEVPEEWAEPMTAAVFEVARLRNP